MIGTNNSRTMAWTKVGALLLAAIALALTTITSMTSASRPLTDRAMAGIRGSSKEVRSVPGYNCTDQALGLLDLQSGVVGVSDSSCTSGNSGTTCIACRVGVAPNSVQMNNGGPTIGYQMDPVVLTCGTAAGSNVGSIGVCTVMDDGSSKCLNQNPYQCPPVRRFNPQ